MLLRTLEKQSKNDKKRIKWPKPIVPLRISADSNLEVNKIDYILFSFLCYTFSNPWKRTQSDPFKKYNITCGHIHIFSKICTIIKKEEKIERANKFTDA